jgi:AraC-like DNA-binding protein
MIGHIHAAPGRDYDSYAEFYLDSAYASFPQEHRARGSFGASMIQIAQEPVDLVDAPVPEFTFQFVRGSMSKTALDLGDGMPAGRAVPPGTLTVMPPDTAIRYCIADQVDLTILTIPKARLVGLFEEAGTAAGTLGPFYGRMRPMPEAGRMLHALWDVSEQGGPSGNLLADGLTLQFLAMVAGSGGLSPLGAARREDVRIARAVDYAEAHLARPLSVGELAEVAALSPSRFARVFRATTGEAVWAYVQRRRLERAEELLRVTSLSVAEIAYRVGYADVSRFGLHFRRRTGRTPSACREG